MEQRITVITLGVADLQCLINFYKKGLGWKRSDKSIGDLTVFDMPGILFALYPIVELAEDVTIPHEPSRFSGIAIAYNTYSEEEVAEILAKVETLGGSIVKPAQKTSRGRIQRIFCRSRRIHFRGSLQSLLETITNRNILFKPVVERLYELNNQGI